VTPTAKKVVAMANKANLIFDLVISIPPNKFTEGIIGATLIKSK
jgi:hypothetical protein